MTFEGFTNEQISDFATILEDEMAKSVDERQLALVYRKVFDAITENFINPVSGQPDQRPLAGVDPGTWTFIRAAAFVNEGSGSTPEESVEPNIISDTTRIYTARQMEVRLGVDGQSAEIQEQIQIASDEIARSVIQDIIDRHGLSRPPLPTVPEIAEDDAAAAAEFLFDDDRGGWAGNPLFIFFGDAGPFERYLLHLMPTIPSEDRGLPQYGTYDLLASADGRSDF